MKSDLDLNAKYLIRWAHGVIIVGQPIETRGNDLEYPTFKVIEGPSTFGPYISTRRSNVREKIIEEKGEDEQGAAST